MPEPRTIVNPIRSFQPADPLFAAEEAHVSAVPVQFANNQIANLALDDPQFEMRSHVLTEMMRFALPVYVEVESPGRNITTLLIPTTGVVLSVRRDPSGDIRFHLDTCAKAFRFPVIHPKYSHFLDVLWNAHLDGVPVLVTEQEDYIVDIRRGEARPEPTLLEDLQAAEAHFLTPSPISQDKANEMFNLVSNASCNPENPASPCIPFLYADSGCEARAAKMCSMMQAQGVTAGKVWNQCPDGDHLLKVHTPFALHCETGWYFHVAATVQVTDAEGATQTQVIDPCLFSDGPVEVAAWIAIQGFPQLQPQFTSAASYLLPGYHPLTDPHGTTMEATLAARRSDLGARAGKIPFQC